MALNTAWFAAPDPSTTHRELFPFEVSAVTLSSSIESDLMVTRWLAVSPGFGVYAQAQEQDVLLSPSSPDPSGLFGERTVMGVGVFFAGRVEAQVRGPVRLGVESGALGVGLRRTRGGTVERDGEITFPRDVDKRWGPRFEGAGTRLYVGVYL